MTQIFIALVLVGFFWLLFTPLTGNIEGDQEPLYNNDENDFLGADDEDNHPTFNHVFGITRSPLEFPGSDDDDVIDKSIISIDMLDNT